MLHDNASGNAEELAQDFMGRGLKSTVRTLDDFDLEGATGPEDCYFGGVHEQAGRKSGKLQADPAEASVSRSSIVRVGRCEVLRFRHGRPTYSQSCVAAAGFDTHHPAAWQNHHQRC